MPLVGKPFLALNPLGGTTMSDENQIAVQSQVNQNINITQNYQAFLQEDNGSFSAMRLMSFIALLAAILFGLLSLILNTGENGIYITYGFLFSAFIPKAIQKFAEQKIPPKK